jgi:hypothetical protein
MITYEDLDLAIKKDEKKKKKKNIILCSGNIIKFNTKFNYFQIEIWWLQFFLNIYFLPF